MEILFWIIFVMAIASALAVIMSRNVVHSALFLLVNFGSQAILYFMLNAQFLGVAQILVYAGAIIVLFLFVVMLLGAETGEPMTDWLNLRTIAVALLGLILVTVTGTAVVENLSEGATRGNLSEVIDAQGGQVEAIGTFLYTDYVLAVHLAAVVLTVGVIGVVWLAQQHMKTQPPLTDIDIKATEGGTVE